MTVLFPTCLRRFLNRRKYGPLLNLVEFDFRGHMKAFFFQKADNEEQFMQQNFLFCKLYKSSLFNGIILTKTIPWTLFTLAAVMHGSRINCPLWIQVPVIASYSRRSIGNDDNYKIVQLKNVDISFG